MFAKPCTLLHFGYKYPHQTTAVLRILLATALITELNNTSFELLAQIASVVELSDTILGVG